MSQLLLTRSPYRQEIANSNARAVPRRSRVSTMKLNVEFGPMVLIVGLMLLAIFLSVMYLMHFNQVATDGYQIQNLATSLQKLTDISEANDITIAKAKSEVAILNSPRIATMVKANGFVYVSGNTALAKADEGS